jgi:hypothetical protein
MAAKERRDRKECQNRFHQPDSAASSPPRLGKIVSARRANGHREPMWCSRPGCCESGHYRNIVPAPGLLSSVTLMQIALARMLHDC